MIISKSLETPLVPAERLATRIGLRRLLLKLESTQPISHTFKDRGALTAVAEAVRSDTKAVIAGTCGNMGVAVAGACARVGMNCLVILSEEAPLATRAMISRFASHVWLVDERFDAIDAELRQLTDESRNVACINTTLNSAFRAGFRTLLRELLLQLDPTHRYAIVVPTADGTLLSACWEEYLEHRESSAQPFSIRFVLAQPAGCAPLVQAIRTKRPIEEWTQGQTCVLPLSVTSPLLHGRDAVNAVERSGGTAVAVRESTVYEYAEQLTTLEGICSDLVGGVLVGAIAELAEMNWFGDDEIPVGLFTGNGLTSCSEFEDRVRRPKVGLHEARIAIQDVLDGTTKC